MQPLTASSESVTALSRSAKLSIRVHSDVTTIPGVVAQQAERFFSGISVSARQSFSARGIGGAFESVGYTGSTSLSFPAASTVAPASASAGAPLSAALGSFFFGHPKSPKAIRKKAPARRDAIRRTLPPTRAS